MPRPPSPALATRLGLLCLAVGACKDPAPKGGDSGDTAAGVDDTATCEPQAPDHWPGCLILQEDDPDGDERYYDQTRSLYDGLGRLSSQTTQSARDWDDWTVCGTTWFEDSAQPLLEWCTGRSDFTYTWTTDASGHPTGKVYDAGRDGEPDRAWSFETDAEGRITRTEQDQDLDGAVDAVNTFTYDAAGHVLSEAWDYDADGTVDYTRTTTWDGDQPTEEVVDSDADGAVDRRTTWTYDAAGHVDLVVVDEDDDGAWDQRTAHTWEDCKLVRVEELDGDGNRTLTTRTYDEVHRLATETVDSDGDGQADATSAWTYTCPF